MRLIIGYGNPLRSDDRLGQYLAETMEDGWIGASIITTIQLTPELAEPISRAERVVFLDASAAETPCEITCDWIQPDSATGAFSHNVTPASLLVAAQALYGRAPTAILVSVSGASFDYGCIFSPPVCDVLPQIVTYVGAIISKFFAAKAEIDSLAIGAG